MKKIGLTLLFSTLVLSTSVRANQEPIIDGTTNPVILVGIGGTPVHFNHSMLDNLPFSDILFGYSVYVDNGRSLNDEVIQSWVKYKLITPLANKFEEKRNPNYYADNAKVIEPILNQFFASNFITANTELNMSVRFNDYDINSEILHLKPWREAKFWQKDTVSCDRLSPVGKKDEPITGLVRMDISECPYVKMPLDVAEKLWGNEPNRRYVYRLVVNGRGNGAEKECTAFKFSCLRIEPQEALFELYKENGRSEELIWTSKDVVFTN